MRTARIALGCRKSVGAFAGVPDIVMIDASGRIAYRSVGWVDERDPNLMRMRLARLAGTEIPMLLDTRGFSGHDKCAVRHLSQRTLVSPRERYGTHADPVWSAQRGI